MFDLLQASFTIIIEVICCKLFSETFSQKRKFRYEFIYYLMLAAAVIVSYMACTILANNFGLKQLATWAIFGLLIYGFFNITVKKALFQAIIYQGILLIVDYLALGILHIFFKPEYILVDNSASRVLAIVFCKMFLFGAIIFIKRFWRYGGVARILSDAEWLRFLLFPFISVLMITAMIANFGYVLSDYQINTLFMIAFGLIAMNVIAFYLIQDIIQREIKLRDERVYKERIKNQVEMYQSISESVEKQRKKSHEYRNQIGCIDGLLKQGEIEEAKKYVQDLYGGMRNEYYFIDTNHPIVNAILNKKYEESASKGIVFVFKVNDLSNIRLGHEDIVTLLSNLLNNAIEACDKSTGEKKMMVKFIEENGIITLSVRNTLVDVPIVVNGKYTTTKQQDKEEHGIGVANIIETVERYGGSYVIQAKDSYFIFSIVIENE